MSEQSLLPEARQFDFWIGDWDATWGEDQRGTNRVRSILTVPSFPKTSTACPPQLTAPDEKYPTTGSLHRHFLGACDVETHHQTIRQVRDDERRPIDDARAEWIQQRQRDHRGNHPQQRSHREGPKQG